MQMHSFYTQFHVKTIFTEFLQNKKGKKKIQFIIWFHEISAEQKIKSNIQRIYVLTEFLQLEKKGKKSML